MMLPSTEGLALLKAARRATSSSRDTLAYMLVGNFWATRTHLLRIWSGDKDIKIVGREPKKRVIEHMLKSRFCIQADGLAPWSPRLVEAIACGCVPVLISNTLLPPFQRLVDWSKLSVQLDQNQVFDLKLILQRIVKSGEYEQLRRNVLAASEIFR
jgi:hypothetical protein